MKEGHTRRPSSHSLHCSLSDLTKEILEWEMAYTGLLTAALRMTVVKADPNVYLSTKAAYPYANTFKINTRMCTLNFPPTTSSWVLA